MKHTLTALTLAFGIALVPAASMAFDLGSLTPNLTYPDQAAAPVTRDNTNITQGTTIVTQGHDR